MDPLFPLFLFLKAFSAVFTTLEPFFMIVETKYFKILVAPIFDVYMMYMFSSRRDKSRKIRPIRVQHTYSARQEKTPFYGGRNKIYITNILQR